MDDERYDIYDPGQGHQDDDTDQQTETGEVTEPDDLTDIEDVSGQEKETGAGCEAEDINSGYKSERTDAGYEVRDKYRADFYDRPEAEKAPRRRKKSGNSAARVFTILLTVCVIGSMGFYGWKYWNMLRDSGGMAEKETENQLSLSQEKEKEQESGIQKSRAMVLDVSDVVAQVMPSVVAITNKSIQEVEYWFRTMEIENESSGSGFIIARTQDELLIATNAHVVQDATSLSVCFTVDNAGEGTEMETAVAEAVIKGMDTSSDLAVVSVTLEDIPEQAKDQIQVATLGSSEDLEIGEPAVAIGNALGYGQSVTLGIISALNRPVTIDGTTNDLIQTDAAINFGNSGGVLLDVEGHVIGISSAKAASYGVEGMGYAIPIDTAKPVLETLMNRVTRKKVDADQVGYLGITPRDISVEGRSLYNMPEGVFVYEVDPGSPADQAGIQRGDVITYFDGNSVDSSERMKDLREYYASGEQVEIVFQRVTGGMYREMTVKVTLR